MADPQNKTRQPFIPWYYFTRAFGAAMIVYGLVFDHTDDRSTIILTGAAILGVDKVARNEKA